MLNMENEEAIIINDLRDLKNLCRICLTKGKKMINLFSEVEDMCGKNICAVYNVLCRVMSVNVS